MLLGTLRSWVTTPRPTILSKFTMEFLASMMFHFLGSASGSPLANGIVLMVLVYYTAKTSGAHINPALSLTFTLLGHTNPAELLFYWLAQFSGAVCGALWLVLLLPHGGTVGSKGCFVPDSRLPLRAVFGWEAACTFTFLVPIFSVVWYTTHKKGYGNTGPLLVGLSLMGSALACGPYTGAALNPARVVASPAVFDCGYDNNRARTLLYYVCGELLGATLAPLAIMPWYGIAPNAWYLHWIPLRIKQLYMKAFKGTLVSEQEEP